MYIDVKIQSWLPWETTLSCHCLMKTPECGGLESQRQLLQVINFFPVKGTHSNLHFWICMNRFQLKKNFASCDKALTETVTWMLSDEEVEFPFSTQRLKSPQQIWQVFLLALWVSVLLGNNDLKQNQFRLASLALRLVVTWLITSALHSTGKHTEFRAEGLGYRSRNCH